jgi:hypothetical protein
VVIAQDVQGTEVARPWVQKAGGNYRALLDQHNQIGKAYNLKYVPVGIAVDEAGHLVRPVGSVNIGDDGFRAELESWARSGAAPEDWAAMEGGGAPRPLTQAEKEADARFQLAIVLLGQTEEEEALSELREAVRLDPQNWLIRKQMWAIEEPEAFYTGEVDYSWQEARKQIEEKELLEAISP